MAHSTRPATTRGWRHHISYATEPPIEYPTTTASLTPRTRGGAAGVVGAGLEREGSLTPNAPSVTALVEGDHPEVPGQGAEARRPVEVGCARPTVQQQRHGSPGRASYVSDVGEPTVREIDAALRC